MKCPFCGYVIDEVEPRDSCTSCLTLSRCKSICCPRCGFAIPATTNYGACWTKIKRWCRQRWGWFYHRGLKPLGLGLKRLVSANFYHKDYQGPLPLKFAGTANYLSLTNLATKQTAVVANLDCPNEADMRKLLMLGFFPGAVFTLERRFPVYICKLGYSRFALDKRLAAFVLVHKDLDNLAESVSHS